MLKRSADIKGSKTVTIIAEGVELEGKIHSPGSIRIDGVVKGEVVAANEVVIGKEGLAEAKITTKDAIIAGNYNGDMISTGEVEITSTGKFTGNLTQKDALLTIAKGGIFKGKSIISNINLDIESGFPKEKDISVESGE